MKKERLIQEDDINFDLQNYINQLIDERIKFLEKIVEEHGEEVVHEDTIKLMKEWKLKGELK